jgi:hypothetical protein
MKSTLSLPAGLAAIWLLTCTSTIQAHTWIDQLSVIASNGTLVGALGYPRGYIQRTAPDFSDYNLQNEVPPDGRPTGNEILSTDLICRQSQFIGNQTAGNPALVAAPGDNIGLIYQENGHVTLLQNSPTKPVGSGTIFIYGTNQPSNNDTYLGIHRVWNTAGTGGDKRGKLLATRPFDDGQCFQNNTSPLAEARRAEFHPLGNDLSCQSDVQLPTDAGTSQYTLYWVWEWPTLNSTGAVITNQSYTTCMDINMTATSQVQQAVNFDVDQVVDFAGVQDQLSTQFLINPTTPPELTGAAGGATSVAVLTLTSSPAQSVTSVPTQSSAAPSSTKAAGGFITVTVTQPASTVIVTNTVEVVAASAAPNQSSASLRVQTSTATASSQVSSESIPKASASAQAPAITQTGAAPEISPFLTPESEIASQAATHQAAATSSSTSEAIPSAATTGDFPDMTPDASSTAVSSTQAPAPAQTTEATCPKLRNRESRARRRRAH